MTHYLFLAFKLILVYFQHTFRCLINEAVYHTNLVLLIICLINNTYKEMFYLVENISLQMRKTRYNCWFYKITMVIFDMIIFKETDQLLFMKPI